MAYLSESGKVIDRLPRSSSVAELIAVNDMLSIVDFASFKREALMFDRIAFPNLRKAIDRLLEQHREVTQPIVNELDWLQEEGILFEPDLNVSEDELSQNQEYQKFYELYWEHASELDSFHGVTMEDLVVKNEESNESAITDEGQRVWRTLSKLIGLEARKASVLLRLFKKLDAYPVLSFLIPPVESRDITKDNILQMVLNEFPIPDELTPWQQIKEFRSDPDSKRKFLALKNWINKMTRTQQTLNELDDELQSLTFEYENHMKVHRMKTKHDALQTVIYFEAGFAGSGWLAGYPAVTAAAGLIIASAFAIKRRQVALLEEEQNAPGKEVAYIMKSRERFDYETAFKT